MAEITVLPHSVTYNTPRASVKGTLLKLSEFWEDWFPEKPPHNFVRGVFIDMWYDPTTSGDKQMSLLHERAGDPSRPFNVVLHTFVSCAYCVEALRASKAGHNEQAWSFAASAGYWCGVMVGDDTRRRWVEPVKTYLRARKAAKARHAPGERITAEVNAWYLENAHRFRSMRKAANHYHYNYLAETDSITAGTVYDWIRECNQSTKTRR